MTALDRAVGALLGLAVGDAVGTALEFAAPGTFAPLDDMVGGGPFRLPAGAWTDDTSMALCLAESLLDSGGTDQSDQLRRYLLWRDSGHLSSTGRCFDIGGTTTRQLSRFARTGEPVDPHVDEEAAANGSLMRLAPVAVRWWQDPEQAAEQAAASSRTTHAAARPVDACRWSAAVLARLVAGTRWEQALATDVGALHPEVARVVAGSFRDRQPPQVRGTGYVADALEAALWAVDGADDVRSAVLRAANLGDDAHTTAAIAGQFAGARWGASGIPADWREKTVLRERVASLAQGLFAAGGGEVDPGWPFDDLLHAWPVDAHVLAGEYPGAPDPARARLKLDLLLDAGVRTVVDLTTPADSLAPYADLLADAAAQRGLAVRHVPFPVPDLGVVADAAYDDVLATVQDSPGRVYVHCWGGVGRTGTVVGCLLVDQGRTADQALARLQELRTGTRKASRPAPETRVQVELVRRREDRVTRG